jgi:hypothetical protein
MGHAHIDLSGAREDARERCTRGDRLFRVLCRNLANTGEIQPTEERSNEQELERTRTTRIRRTTSRIGDEFRRWLIAQRVLLSGTEFAVQFVAMSLVRLLGFTTLACGCVVGRYREVATSRELTYVEEKGKSCGSHSHRRNHTVAADRLAAAVPMTLASKAS